MTTRRNASFVFLVFLALSLFSFAEDHPAPTQALTVPVAGSMDAYLGAWTGKRNITNPNMALNETWIEHLSLKPMLNNKFIGLESSTDVNGKNFSKKAFIKYNADTHQYSLYWFDSSGHMSTFVGDDEGDFIQFREDGPGNTMLLKFAKQGKDRFRISMSQTNAEGSTLPVLDAFYTRDVPPQDNQQQNRDHRGGRRGGMDGMGGGGMGGGF